MKQFLENNKIYLEVISTIGLGFMAIMVSCTANDISKHQSKIAEIQVSPQFRIERDLEYDPSVKRYTDEIAILHNEGFPISDYNTKITSYFKIKLVNGKETISAMQPVIYYVGKYSSDNKKGKLVEFRQPENNSHAARIEREVHQLGLKLRSGYIEVKINNLLSLFYTDALDQQHQKFFYIEGSGGREIPEAEAKELLNELKNPQYFPKNLHETNGHDLTKLVGIYERDLK